jgi:alpha-L-rhamnosidase
MLAKFGYVDTAWKLLTREEYPSWGYMIQNGATTVWERFEQKRGSGMNSHNHPMYGAVDYWFYAYLLGIKPLEEGYRSFEIAPVFPKALGCAEGRVDSNYGEIYLSWRREFEQIFLTIDVPFGTTATLVLPNGRQTLTSGVHIISFEE